MPAPRLTSTLVTAVCATAISTTAAILITPAGLSQTLLAKAAPIDNLSSHSPSGHNLSSHNLSHTVTNPNKGFQPPSNPRRHTGHRTTTGTRQGSCVGDAGTAFTILGPSETVGLSASAHPEFAWYLPPSEIVYPVQFRLLAPSDKGIPTPIYSAELDYAAGFSTYQLPTNITLSPGTDYRWQVVVVCDTGYLSRSLNEERTFEIVPPSREVQQSIDAATTDVQRAQAYGENGFWYDAIAQVVQSNSAQSIALRQELLADLAEIEVENELLKTDLLRLSEIPGQ